MNEFLMAPHDFYQIILAALRYAYTRNNGLEPQTTFGHVKTYLPKVMKVDPEWALKIAQQAAEESISEVHLHYPDDTRWKDTFEDAFAFIKWLVNFIQTNDKEAKYMPYNIGTYIDLSNDTF